jgi:hypothetical protein
MNCSSRAIPVRGNGMKLRQRPLGAGTDPTDVRHAADLDFCDSLLPCHSFDGAPDEIWFAAQPEEREAA